MTVALADGAGIGCARVRDGRWHLDGAVACRDRYGQPIEGPVELVVREGVIERLQPLPANGLADRPGRTPLVLAPLFVNAHDHGRGKGNVAAGIRDAPLEKWLPSLHEHRSAQEFLVREGCAQMLASGAGATVVCVNPQGTDVGAEVLTAAEAVCEQGLRAAVVYPIADTVGAGDGRALHVAGWDSDEVERRLAEVEEVASKIRDPRVEVQLGPVGPQWVSEQTLRAVGQHARRTGRRVHMHLLESRAQRAWADSIYPDALVDLLDDAGLTGPHVCFAHGTQLRPAEMEALAMRGCVLAICASSNLRLCSGVAPLALARGSGISFGAGLDGLTLGDDGDYWGELRLLRGIEQAQTGDVVAAAAFIEGITAGGRRALGACAPNPPAEGEPADFQVLDVSGYEHLLGPNCWTAAEVALAIGNLHRVAAVWVAGRCAYERGGPGRRGAPGGEGDEE